MVDNNKNVIKTDNNIEVYTSDIYMWVDSFIDSLKDPDEINTNTGLFASMISYLYNNCIQYILNNNPLKNRSIGYTNINLINEIFDIYTDLVYKYKLSNKRLTILEFSLFSGISRDCIYDWLHNINKELTPEYRELAKKIHNTCENSIVNDDKNVVKSIFLLKSKYDYSEMGTRSPERITQAAAIQELPSFDTMPGITDTTGN